MDVEELEQRLNALEARVYKNDLPRPVIYSVGANLTLNQSEMNVWHMIEATDPFNLTLPAPYEGMWVGVWNYGDSTITVKDDAAATIGTIAPAQGSHIVCPIVSGVADWPSGIIVVSALGGISIPGNLVLTTAANGVVFATAGNYFELTSDAAGVLTTTDVGATYSGF